MRSRRILALVATLFAAGLLFATSAAAFAPVNFTQRWANLSGQAYDQVAGSVSCPAGMKAVSAGGGNANLASVGLTPNGSGAFVVGVLNNPNYLYLPLVADCVPAAQLAGSTSRSVTFQAHTGNVGDYVLFSQTVTCPTGTYAFGGGGYFVDGSGSPTPAGFNMQADAPTADQTGWSFATFARSGVDTMVVTTQCAPLPAPTLVTTPYAVNGLGGGYGNCPSGHVPLSGGASLDPPVLNSSLVYTEVVRNTAPNLSGWYASASTNYPGVVLRVVSQCL